MTSLKAEIKEKSGGLIPFNKEYADEYLAACAVDINCDISFCGYTLAKMVAEGKFDIESFYDNTDIYEEMRNFNPEDIKKKQKYFDLCINECKKSPIILFEMFKNENIPFNIPFSVIKDLSYIEIESKFMKEPSLFFSAMFQRNDLCIEDGILKCLEIGCPFENMEIEKFSQNAVLKIIDIGLKWASGKNCPPYFLKSLIEKDFGGKDFYSSDLDSLSSFVIKNNDCLLTPDEYKAVMGCNKISAKSKAEIFDVVGVVEDITLPQATVEKIYRNFVDTLFEREWVEFADSGKDREECTREILSQTKLFISFIQNNTIPNGCCADLLLRFREAKNTFESSDPLMILRNEIFLALASSVRNRNSVGQIFGEVFNMYSPFDFDPDDNSKVLSTMNICQECIANPVSTHSDVLKMLEMIKDKANGYIPLTQGLNFPKAVDRIIKCITNNDIEKDDVKNIKVYKEDAFGYLCNMFTSQQKYGYTTVDAILFRLIQKENLPYLKPVLYKLTDKNLQRTYDFDSSSCFCFEFYDKFSDIFPVMSANIKDIIHIPSPSLSVMNFSAYQTEPYEYKNYKEIKERLNDLEVDSIDIIKLQQIFRERERFRDDIKNCPLYSYNDMPPLVVRIDDTSNLNEPLKEAYENRDKEKTIPISRIVDFSDENLERRNKNEIIKSVLNLSPENRKVIITSFLNQAKRVTGKNYVQNAVGIKELSSLYKKAILINDIFKKEKEFSKNCLTNENYMI